MAEVALTGIGASAAAGSVASAVEGGDSAPTLRGMGTTSAAGTLALAALLALTGIAPSGAAGTIAPTAAFTLGGISIAGVYGVLAVDVSGGTATVNLTGWTMTAGLGELNIGGGIVTIRITQSAETPYVFISHHVTPDVKFSETFTVNVPTSVEAEIETALLNSSLGWEKLVDDEVTETHPATY